MSSKAFQNLGARLNDIDQLLEAHSLLTQFKRGEKAARDAGGELSKLSGIVDALVSQPGPGRPAEVGALNRSAMVLLCAHLQGYIEDVYREAAKLLLTGRVQDVDSLISQGLSTFSNPHADRIDRLFASVGLPRLTPKLSWQKANPKSVKERLSAYIAIRNDIAHGKQVSVRKAKVEAFRRFVDVFTRNFDELVASQLTELLHRRPW